MSKQSLDTSMNAIDNQQTSVSLKTSINNCKEDIVGNTTKKSSIVENGKDTTVCDGDRTEIVAEKLPESTSNTDKGTNSNNVRSTSTQSIRANTSTHLSSYDVTNTSTTMDAHTVSQDVTEVRASIASNRIPTTCGTSKDSTSFDGRDVNVLPARASPLQRPDPHVTKARAVDYRSEPPLSSRTPATGTPSTQNKKTQYPNSSQNVQRKANNSDYTNTSPSNSTYNYSKDMAQYEKPFGAIPPYPPSVLQHRHHAAEAAAAASVAAQLDAKNSATTMMRHQIPASVTEIGNRVKQGNESKPKPVAPRNQHIPPHSDIRNSRGHPHMGTHSSFTVGQHNAASSAAEQHIQWRVNTVQNRNANSFPEVIEIDDDGEQKEELIQHFTAAISRQLGGAETSAGLQDAEESYPNNQGFHHWHNRKRSLPEPMDNETHKRAAMTRQTLPVPNTPNYVDRSFSTSRSGNVHGSVPSNRVNHITIAPQPQHSTMREVNVSDAMNIALDVAISSDSSQNSKTVSSSGRRVDTPMTYLVRQLLGQVEILGDEPAVVLAPSLVKDASNKIRLVINKLIEMIVVKAKKDSHAKIREVESRVDALQRSNHSSGRDKAVEDANQQKKFLALKTFAEEKCHQLADRDRLIEHLRTKLEVQEAEMENSIIRQSNDTKSIQSYEEKSNATMRHLIARLDEGLTTIQRQEKEIKVLKAFIDRNKSSLQKKGEMTATIEHTNIAPNYDAAHNQEIALLKAELEGLQATLLSEREQHENTLKAYMRAAVHALKIQSGECESPM